MRETNLFNSFLNFFPESDAFLLTELIEDNPCKETIRYEEIGIPESQKKDLILLAFEERILIPVTSRSGPAWEDRLLDFSKKSTYVIPPIVKAILDTMRKTGEPSCDTAVRKTLTRVVHEDISGFITILQTLMRHADNCVFETGLLEIFFKETNMDYDLHDIVDIFVICGIISPCPRKSLMTGLSWYEINPTLYWDKTFLS
ncbi:MAG: hypothetical protein PVH55_02315 [Desulfobacterales bacterium]|jgi:hypothetical protein